MTEELNPEQPEEISGGINLNVLTGEDRAEYKRLERKMKEHMNDADFLEFMAYRQKLIKKYGSDFQRNP